jgi:hypothetical protein
LSSFHFELSNRKTRAIPKTREINGSLLKEKQR